MADKRDQIMSAVESAMQGIQISGGYNSDLGSNVYVWRPKIVTEGGASYAPTEQSELPALHIRDSLDEISPMNQKGDENHSLTVEFEVAHEGGASPSVFRGQINDVRKAVGIDPTWGGLAKNTSRETSADTIRLQADRVFFRTLMRIRINYSTSAFGEE